MVTLDHAGEALALGHAAHVHLLAHLEDVHADRAARLEVGKRLRRHPEFLQDVARLDARFREMAGCGLVDAGRAPLAERDLDRAIAVGFGVLDLRDAVVGDVHDRHRDGVAIVGEHARHADLAADQS